MDTLTIVIFLLAVIVGGVAGFLVTKIEALRTINKHRKKLVPVQATKRRSWNYVCRIVVENFNSKPQLEIKNLTFYESHTRISKYFIESIYNDNIFINFNYFTHTRLDALIDHVYDECSLHVLNIDKTLFRAEIHHQISLIRKEVI